uniref:7TM_GPCR_Srx domain-containing protein n=1 Tax=Heterorhabditis bacteriophora TaxID=37862 RepID=A0A1I7WD19_HETBA
MRIFVMVGKNIFTVHFEIFQIIEFVYNVIGLLSFFFKLNGSIINFCFVRNFLNRNLILLRIFV